jgi:multidrug efflux system membrane fusion protein
MTTSGSPVPQEPAPRAGGGARRWILALVLLLAGGALAYYVGRGHLFPQDAPHRRSNADDPVPVRVVSAKQDDVDVLLKALGTVTPLNTVTVRSRLDGELTKVLFTEGQRVQAGQLLAEVDARPYQVALEQAQGTQQENQARLKNAETDLATYKSLFEQQLITRQQVTSQEALVRQYQGALQSNEAQVNNARLQLAYTKILAPIEGRLGLRQVDAGNFVRSGDVTGLVVITQMRPISVLFTIPESDLPAVLTAFRGQQRALRVEAWDRAESQKLTEGVLQTVDNQIDTATGTIKLRASFGNDDEKLFPNQFVNIRLRITTLAKATVIPSAAVQRASFGTFVYVAKADATATVRRVTLGPAEGDQVAIVSGLEPGEQVVLEGVDGLREGAKIEVIGAGSGSDAGGAGSAAAPAPARRPAAPAGTKS